MSGKTKKQVNTKETELQRSSPAVIKKTVVSVTAAVIIMAVIVWALMAYNAAISLIKPSKSAIALSPEDIGRENFDAIAVYTDQGDILSGWYIPASDDIDVLGDKIVIMSHNYESNREMSEISGMYFYKYLLEAGYDVVTFDYSGSGTSTGSYYSFGSQEKDELLAVVNYVHKLNPDADIALCGWAFGAAAAISAGCESEYVTAVIADSSYTDLDTYLDGYLKNWTGLPSFLFDSTVRFLMEEFADCDFSDISPIRDLRNTEGKSFYFIHCTEDYIIPPASSEALFAAAEENNYAEIWTVNGEHILGFELQEENYKDRIIYFLSEHL